MIFAAIAFAFQLQAPLRTIAVDEAFAEAAHLKVGDRVTVSARPSGEVGLGAAGADSVVVGAIVKRGADPAEVARGEFRIRMHLDQLQHAAGYGDRVDRFAIATRRPANIDNTL
ncbi:MAG TPA: hypothetical protein VM166_02660, partial [Gemmatimonadaceae bacterium]|nr:hypothetical protein [Gemmatimonadaceae bacterium]